MVGVDGRWDVRGKKGARWEVKGGSDRLTTTATTTVDEFGIPLVIRSRRRSRTPGYAVARRVLKYELPPRSQRAAAPRENSGVTT